MNPTEQMRSSTFQETLLSARRTMVLSEILKLAMDSFRASKVRFALTALGMVIGTASVILVVTIGLTGKQYHSPTDPEDRHQLGGARILRRRRHRQPSAPYYNDSLTRDDEKAVLAQLPGVMYSSPVMEMHARINFGSGVVKDTLVLGVSPQYRDIRNLLVPAGRFFDETDESAHIKCAVVTEKFAHDRFGSADSAIGQSFEISGIPFTIIGVFKDERRRFWPIGDRRPDDPDSLFGGALLYRNREREADLLFHAHHGRGARSGQRDQTHRAGAPSRPARSTRRKR